MVTSVFIQILNHTRCLPEYNFRNMKTVTIILTTLFALSLSLSIIYICFCCLRTKIRYVKNNKCEEEEPLLQNERHNMFENSLPLSYSDTLIRDSRIYQPTPFRQAGMESSTLPTYQQLFGT